MTLKVPAASSEPVQKHASRVRATTPSMRTFAVGVLKSLPAWHIPDLRAITSSPPCHHKQSLRKHENMRSQAKIASRSTS